MIHLELDLTLQASSTTDIKAAGSIGGSGSLSLLSTSTSDSMGHKIIITSAGNDSGLTFTVSGTDVDGRTVSESITGPNTTTATSTNYYASDLAISVDGASAGNVSIGWDDEAVSKQLIGECYAESSTTYVQATGTVNYTVQFCNQKTKLFDLASSPAWQAHTDTDVVTATADASGSANVPVCAYRVVVNSYSSTPSLYASFTWAG